MFCEKCGTELKEHEHVCANCGAKNEYCKPVVEENAEEKESGIFSILALVFVSVPAIIFFLLLIIFI